MAEKKFRLSASQIKDIIPGFGGCIASDRILVDGARVGYMLRDEPSNPEDSGWQIMAGDETQAYMDDADHFGIYEVNTLVNYDREILPFLYSEIGSAYARGKDGRFQPEGRLPPTPSRKLTAQWSMTLNSCFRQRIEDQNLVLWAPARTIWSSVREAKKGESPDQRLAWIKKEANPAPVQRFEPTHPILKRFAYLLMESDDEKGARWGLYTTSVAPTGGHLWMSIYFDFKEDLDWALRTWDSVVFKS